MPHVEISSCVSGDITISSEVPKSTPIPEKWAPLGIVKVLLAVSSVGTTPTIPQKSLYRFAIKDECDNWYNAP